MTGIYQVSNYTPCQIGLVKGERGENGANGANGLNGKDGKDGKDGLRGLSGSDGKSLYQIALDNGFVGTFDDYQETLRGEKGLKGDAGVDAAIDSLTVSTGAAGTSASVVTGGTPISRTFALTIPRGDKGDKGDGGSFLEKSYKTYAEMELDKPNLTANISTRVSNDSDTAKNGSYTYDGTVFTRSQYDSKVVTDKVIADTAIAVQDAINNTAVEGGVLADTFVTATAYGSGSIARTQRDINSERISVHDFGAIGDGQVHTLQEWIASGRYNSLADIQAEHPTATALTNYVDRVAIQSCIDYCAAVGVNIGAETGATVTGKGGSIYRTDETIYIHANLDLAGTDILIDKEYAGAAVRIGHTDGTRMLRGRTIKLPSVKSTKDLTDNYNGSVGVLIEGTRNTVVDFADVWGFEENIKLNSSDGNYYVSYCTFNFSATVWKSLINIHLNISGGGWVNECTWNGGQFATSNAELARHSNIRCLVLTAPPSATNNPPNGHRFNNASMEGFFTKTIEYEYGEGRTNSFYSANRFVSCRFEAAKAFKMNQFALDDTFIACQFPATDVFEGFKPDVIGSATSAKYNLFVPQVAGTSRKASKTLHYSASRTGLLCTYGVGDQINASIDGTGEISVYDDSDVSKEFPVISINRRGALPSLYMGFGATAATDRLYLYSSGGWRHNFNLQPNIDDTLSLGLRGLAYKEIFTNQLSVKGGVGVFNAYPPSTKPVVTGLKTPTTIAEQKVVTDSLIAALVSYGLIADNRT